ncbi:sensor histidine kinase [Arcicella aurantiaca]|nr:histidine kinase [Arcicella aurantiaca]
MANSIWLMIYVMIISFFIFEYSIPFIKFRWKRLLMLPFIFVFYIFMFSFGFYWWRNIGVSLHIYFAFTEYKSTRDALSNFFPRGLFSAIVIGIIKYSYDFRVLKETAQKLRIEKQEAELNYLKSQTNPHFLFNTLNNIYSLARDNDPLASESILRLSKILRFMLYQTNVDFIAIEQELKIMEDYISLEKLRYDESLIINFNHSIEDIKQEIPPLLLIPFVENAFKHGVSETRNNPFVDIHLSVQNHLLLFIVKNSTEKSPSHENSRENIGLSNLRRQLELLYKDYEVNVFQGEFDFTATLKINLKSHV